MKVVTLLCVSILLSAPIALSQSTSKVLFEGEISGKVQRGILEATCTGIASDTGRPTSSSFPYDDTTPVYFTDDEGKSRQIFTQKIDAIEVVGGPTTKVTLLVGDEKIVGKFRCTTSLVGNTQKIDISQLRTGTITLKRVSANQ